MSKGIEISIRLPYFPEAGHPEKEKAEGEIRAAYGDPHVGRLDPAFREWEENASYYVVPEKLHPFLGHVRSRQSGLGRHHFITMFELEDSDKVNFYQRHQPDVQKANQVEMLAFFSNLKEALENKRFKADKNLRIELIYDKWCCLGYKLYPRDDPRRESESDKHYRFKHEKVLPIILKDNDCDFTVYGNYTDYDKADIPSTGKSRVLFYLRNPQSSIVAGSVSIIYEMARKRTDGVHPPGQNAEKLKALCQCKLDPQETLFSLACYLEHDLMFYDSEGNPASWWQGFVARLKEFGPPEDPFSPEANFSNKLWLHDWGEPPFVDED